jgi:hypothetical protein
MTRADTDTVAFFQDIVLRTRAGELPFETLAELLETLVAAANHPVAAMLYREWSAHRRTEIRCSAEIHARLAAALEQLGRHEPGLPPLPPPAEWLKIDIGGRQMEYRDIDDPFFIEIIGRVQKHTITMLTGAEPPWELYRAIGHIVKHGIPGDLVECGVWNGGSVLLMALALKHFGDTTRKIYLYDTFEGMPRPGDLDRDWKGVAAIGEWEAMKSVNPEGINWGFGGTVETVQEVVFSSGYPRENFVFVKGMVEQTIPGVRPERIALLRLDTDFYASTHHELVHLYPLVSPGGMLIIDDYGCFQGARIAVDQYFRENPEPVFLSRVTQDVRLAVRPGSAAAGVAPAPAGGPPDQTQYVMHGDPAKSALAAVLNRAFFQAMALDHKLPPWVVALRGMSGTKYRYLVNRLVEGMPGARYLEVGSWTGSTVCAAAFGNAVDALCIDNWSEFGGPRDRFLANVAAVTGPSTRIAHLERDFRKVDFASIGRFDIYLFDGPHGEQDHVDGIVMAMPALEDEFVLVVGDWNWAPVRAGTTRALRDGGIETLFAIEIRTTQNGGVPRGPLFETSEWHNGYFIAVCRKRART